MAVFPFFEVVSEQRWRMHASAVCVNGVGILLLGPPASGKSVQLAARIAAGASLIGDDYLIIEREGDALYASPVPEIAGVLALDGVPLLSLPYVSRIPLKSMQVLVPYDGNPLAFTGLTLPHDATAIPEPQATARAFAENHIKTGGVTLPPDWRPQKAASEA